MPVRKIKISQEKSSQSPETKGEKFSVKAFQIMGRDMVRRMRGISILLEVLKFKIFMTLKNTMARRRKIPIGI